MHVYSCVLVTAAGNVGMPRFSVCVAQFMF